MNIDRVTSVFCGVAVAAGVIGGAIYVFNKVTGEDDFLTSLWNSASGSISEYETVQKACTPALAASIGAALDATQPQSLHRVSVSMHEDRNFCNVLIENPVVGNRHDGSYTDSLHYYDVTNMLGYLRDPVGEVVEGYNIHAAPFRFCAHFNETVMPALASIGLSKNMYGEYDSGDNECYIRYGADIDGRGDLLTVLDTKDFNPDGSLEDMEWRSEYIMDQLPIDDRRLINDRLPDFLNARP